MPSTIVDSHIFQGIFSSDEMRHVWSDENRTQKYLDIESALAKVQGRLGLIPRTVAVPGYTSAVESTMKVSIVCVPLRKRVLTSISRRSMCIRAPGSTSIDPLSEIREPAASDGPKTAPPPSGPPTGPTNPLIVRAASSR